MAETHPVHRVTRKVTSRPRSCLGSCGSLIVSCVCACLHVHALFVCNYALSLFVCLFVCLFVYHSVPMR